MMACKLRKTHEETVIIERMFDGRGKEYRRITNISGGNVSTIWKTRWCGDWDDVRRVYHSSQPQQLESAYQELKKGENDGA